uniref:Uncharacterized protein n=1 Tax=Anopheles albimanus TaxID=7167 RepID=A0A182F7G0_ANOAL
MKRHYYVQKMDSQERLGMPVGTIAGQDDAGIYTVTVPYRTELSLPAMPHSVTFDTIVQTAASLPPIGDNTTVDFGTVNIYQSLPPLAAQSLTSPDGMKCGLGKATVGERDDKNDNGSNVTGSALGGNANDEDTDIISEYIGHYGWWQFGWTFVLCLFQIPTTFHIFCLVFQVGVAV